MQARLAKARMVASLHGANPNSIVDDLDMPDDDEDHKVDVARTDEDLIMIE